MLDKKKSFSIKKMKKKKKHFPDLKTG